LNKRLPLLAQGGTFFPVQMEFSLSHFPVDAFHTSGFLGQDTGVLEQDA